MSFQIYDENLYTLNEKNDSEPKVRDFLHSFLFTGQVSEYVQGLA